VKNRVDSFSRLETPFYYYDLDLLKETLDHLKKASKVFFHVHYALKANVNPRILEVIREAGLGVDCVSGGEIKIALDNGFKSNQIVLAGVGKTDKEITFALQEDIFSFNVESIAELEVINEIAGNMGKTARISMRINPEIEAGTHHYITTGAKENKFGVSVSELLDSLSVIRSCKSIQFIGLHYHIGSQIVDLERFKVLADRVNQLQAKLREEGFDLPVLNLGGGLGIDYENPDLHPIPDFEGYLRTFRENLEILPNQEVHLELGRSIVGQCGSLISKVLYIKEGGQIKFAILDAGMTELMRPALYQAVHKLQNLSSDLPAQTYDVVGPICESSDFFAKKIQLPKTQRGDLIAIRSTGAYGQTMRSNYNGRDFAETYYSDDLGH
jgi:diaminopimelate decarboxylase